MSAFDDDQPTTPTPPVGPPVGPPPGPPTAPAAPPASGWGAPPAPPTPGWGSPPPGPPITPPPTGGFPPPPGPQPYPGGYQPYGQPMMVNPFESRATTVLILGILGLVFCQVLSPVALVMGNSLRRDAAAGGYPEPGTGKAGRICGMIGTILLVLFALIIVVAVVGGLATSSSSYSYGY